MKSIDFRIFRTNSIPDFLPIGSLWLETSATALRGPYVKGCKGEIPGRVPSRKQHCLRCLQARLHDSFGGKPCPRISHVTWCGKKGQPNIMQALNGSKSPCCSLQAVSKKVALSKSKKNHDERLWICSVYSPQILAGFCLATYAYALCMGLAQKRP